MNLDLQLGNVLPSHKLSSDYVVVSDLGRLVEAIKGLHAQALESRDRITFNTTEDKISNWIIGVGGLFGMLAIVTLQSKDRIKSLLGSLQTQYRPSQIVELRDVQKLGRGEIKPYSGY